MTQPKYDKFGTYVHDWIVESSPNKGDFMFILKSERHKCEGGSIIKSTVGNIRMVDLGVLAKDCGLYPSLEVCNILAYTLDKREDLV